MSDRGRQLLEQVEAAAVEREREAGERRLRDYHEGSQSWWSDPNAKETTHRVDEPGDRSQPSAVESPSQSWLSDLGAVTSGVADEGYPHIKAAELAELRRQHPGLVIEEATPQE